MSDVFARLAARVTGTAPAAVQRRSVPFERSAAPPLIAPVAGRDSGGSRARAEGERAAAEATSEPNAKVSDGARGSAVPSVSDATPVAATASPSPRAGREAPVTPVRAEAPASAPTEEIVGEALTPPPARPPEPAVHRAAEASRPAAEVAHIAADRPDAPPRTSEYAAAASQPDPPAASADPPAPPRGAAPRADRSGEPVAAAPSRGSALSPEEFLRDHLGPALARLQAIRERDVDRLVAAPPGRAPSPDPGGRVAVGFDAVEVPAGGEVHVHIDRVDVVRPAPPTPAPAATAPAPPDHAAYLARQRERWAR